MGIRKSRQRDAILNVLLYTTRHPSAETIYEELKSEMPNLSLGTVYRNLANFKADGTIMQVATVNGQERYDANTKPHIHFVCKECGEVIDLFQANFPEVPEFDGRIDDCQLNYLGLCKDCVENARSLA